MTPRAHRSLYPCRRYLCISPLANCACRNGTTVVRYGRATAKLEVQPAKVDFGRQEVGTLSAATRVRLYNAGNTPVEIRRVTLEGSSAFHIPGNCTNVRLDPGRHACSTALRTVRDRDEPRQAGHRQQCGWRARCRSHRQRPGRPIGETPAQPAIAGTGSPPPREARTAGSITRTAHAAKKGRAARVRRRRRREATTANAIDRARPMCPPRQRRYRRFPGHLPPPRPSTRSATPGSRRAITPRYRTSRKSSRRHWKTPTTRYGGIRRCRTGSPWLRNWSRSGPTARPDPARSAFGRISLRSAT